MTFTVGGISVTKDDVAMIVLDNNKSSTNNYMATTKCYSYKKMGHISHNCPKKKKTAEIGATTDKTPNVAGRQGHRTYPLTEKREPYP